MSIVVDVNRLVCGGKEYIEIVVPPYPVAISCKGVYYYRSGSTMQTLYGFLIIIALITVFNIFNSMNASVAARTRQYGVMRSIGMGTGQLYRMIAAEAATYAETLSGPELESFILRKRGASWDNMPHTSMVPGAEQPSLIAAALSYPQWTAS